MGEGEREKGTYGKTIFRKDKLVLSSIDGRLDHFVTVYV